MLRTKTKQKKKTQRLFVVVVGFHEKIENKYNKNFERAIKELITALETDADKKIEIIYQAFKNRRSHKRSIKINFLFGLGCGLSMYRF